MESFVNLVTTVNNAVNSVVWGVPALILLVGTGFVMTFLTKFFQFTHFGHWMKETIGKLFSKKTAGAVTHSKDSKSISQFQSLCTALSATIGTGNIAGIAYAITMGGPGAVFWMWIAAIVGMMTNYSENVLGIFFRRRNPDGEWSGGAMYYLSEGLGAKKGCKWIGKILAVLFCIFALMASFGIGNMGQVASIKESILALGSPTGNATYDGLLIGIVVLIFAALVILGGLKRIASTNEKIVPFMAIFYVIGSLIIICMNAEMILPAFGAIFKGAFSLEAAAGGVGGYVIMQAITWGFKRGVFSNEAGLGSSVMVHSTSDIKEPVRQGMWGIFEVFVDTIIVCTMTALVILTSGVVDLGTGASFSGLTKLGLATEAFTLHLGTVGGIFVSIAVCLFAFSTTLGWSVYGSKAWEYLFGTKSLPIYKVIFVAAIMMSCVMDASLAIDLSDTFNGLMAIPNLIGVLTMSGTVLAITKNYIDRKIKGKDISPLLSYDPKINDDHAKAVANGED